MRKLLTIIMSMFVAAPSTAQETHAIESSLLEVHYTSECDGFTDLFVLRCGATTSQYFSYYNLRTDSMSQTREGFAILHKQIMDWAANPEDKSKQLANGPCHGEYLYRNMTEGKTTIYTSLNAVGLRITEESLKVDWNVEEDSIKNILGYDCSMATTLFRGRQWKVWFTYDIPLPQGPWKLIGLPGLILQAECEGVVKLEANHIQAKGLTPVTFYNFRDKKFENIERTKYLQMKTDRTRYAKGTYMTPYLETE